MMETSGKVTGIGDVASGGTSGTVARTVDQATTTAHRAIDRASEAARPAVDKVASTAHQAVDRMAGAATSAAETLDLRTEQFRDAQERIVEDAREYVRDNPMLSVGLAVAAGFLLSRLLSSRD
jgi:ElaB/YqjD/DUF883 family membrane-anchored ribosome-binding protein